MAPKMYLLIFIITFENIQISFELEVNDTVTFQTTDTCVCGRASSATPRVVGGKKSTPHNYPWMVVIFGTTKIHCSGTLINDRYILTAGHCSRMKLEEMHFYLGVHEISGIGNGTAKEMEGEFIKIHETFDYDVKDDHDVNDIALIKLKNPVVPNSKISPICLPEDKDYIHVNSTVAGWGRLSEKSEPAKELFEADLKTLSNEECKSHKNVGEYIQPSMICAYGINSDACKGDSGGPLMFERKSENSTGKFWEQIGIISWGIGCARPEMPGVYTRVPYFLDWIANNTKDAVYCKKPY